MKNLMAVLNTGTFPPGVDIGRGPHRGGEARQVANPRILVDFDLLMGL
jgi:hypothetical protein